MSVIISWWSQRKENHLQNVIHEVRVKIHSIFPATLIVYHTGKSLWDNFVNSKEIWPEIGRFILVFKLFWYLWIGLGTEFRTEKIPRNRLGTISVIPRRKVLIPRHSKFRGRANSEARNGTERNGIPRKNEVLRNSHGLYDYSDIKPATSPL